jgi:hypothetical protein
MAEVGGSSDQSWDAWWREENAFYRKLSWTWKLFLIVQKCFLWVFIAKGLAGHMFLTDPGEQGRFLEVVGLFALFFFGNWIVNKLERSLSYAVRRFASLCLTTFVMVAVIYLVCLHTQYIRYTVAIYYFLSAVSFLFLVMGMHNQIYFAYKLHDYVVGHSIFLLLIVLGMLQLGYFQTWLLYYDALSAGVEMKDILNYARRSKERSRDEIDQLKAQNEKLLQLLSSKGTSEANVELVERTSLLSYPASYKGGSFGYGSTAPHVKDSSIIVVNPLNAAVSPNSTLAPIPSFGGSPPRGVAVPKGQGTVLTESPRSAPAAKRSNPVPSPSNAGGGGVVVVAGNGGGIAGIAAPEPTTTRRVGPVQQGIGFFNTLQSSPQQAPQPPSQSFSPVVPLPPAAQLAPAPPAPAKEEPPQSDFVFSQPTQFPSRN